MYTVVVSLLDTLDLERLDFVSAGNEFLILAWIELKPGFYERQRGFGTLGLLFPIPDAAFVFAMLLVLIHALAFPMPVSVPTAFAFHVPYLHRSYVGLTPFHIFPLLHEAFDSPAAVSPYRIGSSHRSSPELCISTRVNHTRSIHGYASRPNFDSVPLNQHLNSYLNSNLNSGYPVTSLFVESSDAISWQRTRANGHSRSINPVHSTSSTIVSEYLISTGSCLVAECECDFDEDDEW